MQLFCFASRNERNIELGVKNKRWAVATVSDTAMRTRITKARTYFHVDDVGLLYSNVLHSFTVPFLVKSKANPKEIVTDIWPEPWALPFDIEPLVDQNSRIHKGAAVQKWRLFQRIPWKGSISATLNFTGTTVFVPTKITESEWSEILSDLGS